MAEIDVAALLRLGARINVVAEVANDPERRRTWWCPACQPGPAPAGRG